MHKITKVLLGTVAPAALLAGVMTVSPANAATDHRACVTKAEYQSVQVNMSNSRVKGILDGQGALLTSQYYGFWVGDWVWDDYSGDYYWDDYASYEEGHDTVRAYKKCTAWGGGGRVAINFANYDQDGEWTDGMRVWDKYPNHAQSVADYIDYLYWELNNSEEWITSSSLDGEPKPDEAHNPNGGEDRKLPQAPDGRRPAKPTQPPAGVKAVS